MIDHITDYKSKLETELGEYMEHSVSERSAAAIRGMVECWLVLDQMEDCVCDGGESATKGLDRASMQRWVDGMVNADGTRGAHWSMDQTTAVGRAHGVDMAAIGPECWWVTMCMMYSDYYHTAAMFGLDREDFYASLAKDFLSDPDAPGGAKAKLEGYYRGVVEG